MSPKKTPLYSAYLARNATMRDAAGYFTPAFFTDPREEHIATREAAGLFEIFGQFLLEVAGPGAIEFLNANLVAEFATLADGKVIYTSILTETGGMLDDLTVFRVHANRSWVVPAPHRIDLIEALLAKRAPADVQVLSLGYKYTSLSLQGPNSRAILAELTDVDLSTAALPGFSFTIGDLAGFADTVISRTGFTGELGYELFIRTERVEEVYDRLLEVGADHGLKPCGVASLMSLRIEKRFPVYGRDLNDTMTPIEAGLGWTVRPKDADYPGKAAVERQKTEGAATQMVLLRLAPDAEIPVAGEPVTVAGAKVGHVTSAHFGHTVGHPLAIAHIASAHAKEGAEVIIDGQSPATVHPKAIYDPRSSRSRV